jgi:hypothetical protein
MNWINVNDKLPDNERSVLFFWENSFGKKRISKGFYVSKFSTVADTDLWGDFGEYSEEEDEFFIPEGWYESTWEGETIYDINNVTHWMPLPEPPKD